MLQNSLSESREKIDRLKRRADGADHPSSSQAELKRKIVKQLKQFESRLTNMRREMTLKNANLSDLFCQLARYEQLQRDLETWIRGREAEFSSLFNTPGSVSLESQTRRFKRCKVSHEIILVY